MSSILKEITPSEIESQLNLIWESFQATTTTRACLFNLIFYTQQDHRTSYIRKVADNVVKKFPARVIFITSDRNSKEDYLKTQVSILSSGKEEYDVACDFIQFTASGASLEKIPFVVLPQILPDLPIYLVWGEDPCHNEPLFQQLSQFAYRLIFDSEATKNLSQFASRLLDKYTQDAVDIADLNWARIETWRDILSATFYSQEKLEQIQRAKSLKITYNSQTTPFFCHTQIQALYLQAWLACQLDWKFEKMIAEKGQIKVLYRNLNSPLEVELNSISDSKLPPGLILSLDLTTTSEEHFKFDRNLELINQITLNFSNPQHCDMPCKFLSSQVESGHSLVKEIYHRGTSEHFIKALKLLQKMGTLDLC